MSLAAPAALLLGIIALPIVVLYILKVRLRRIPVSTNLFWKQMFDEKPPRALWRKLRHLISLLAQLLILLLLVLAIADPFFSWQTSSARRIVLVMDTSASMQATDLTPTRFDAARQAAYKILDGVRDNDSVAIVSASNRPEVILGMGGHVPTLKAALAKLRPNDGGASITQAVELAKQLIGDHPNGQVLVMTDGCAERPELIKIEQLDRSDSSTAKTSTPGPDQPNAPASQASDSKDGDSTDNDSKGNDSKETDSKGSTASNSVASQKESVDSKSAPADDNKVDPSVTTKPIDVKFVQFASTANNIGITQFQARRSLSDALGYQILVSVLNASDKSVDCRLEIELDDVPADILPLNLKPGESWTRALEKTSLEGGVLSASLRQIRSPEDSPSNGPAESTTKQSAKTASPGNQSTNAAETSSLNRLSTDDRAWAIVPPRKIQNVLLVTPGNLFLQKVFEANQLVRLTVVKELPQQWPGDSIVVLHKLIPEKLPAGDLLVIDPESNCELWEVGGTIENPIVTQQDEKSLLMTHVRLDNVLMPDAKLLNFDKSANIAKLASTVSGETVFASQTIGQSKRLILSINLEKSDLAFRTAFPIVVSNALGWFAGGNGQLEPAIAAGTNARLVDNNEVANQSKSDSSSTTEKSRWLLSPEKIATQLAGSITAPLQHVGVWSVFGLSEESSSESTSGTSNSKANSAKKLDANSKSTATPHNAEYLSEHGQMLQQVAVNLSSAAETDLRPASDEDSAIASLQTNWFTRPLWFYLAALVCVLSVIEWCLYQRRIIT